MKRVGDYLLCASFSRAEMVGLLVVVTMVRAHGEAWVFAIVPFAIAAACWQRRFP